MDLNLATAPTDQRLLTTRRRVHPRCVVCSPANPMGLGREFALQPDGSVEAWFTGNELFEGYAGLLHGGVIAALLDGAMTNCLFARGLPALTAELTIRYRRPVGFEKSVSIRAWLVESHGRLHTLGGELRQAGALCAFGRAKFIETHE